MRKYSPLATRLEENASSSLTFTFAEISEMVGGLPPSAFSYRAWWANNDHQVQGRAWSNAGYGVESVDLAAAVVTFVRRMRESTEEEVDGFLAEFYDKHNKYEYGDVMALNFAQVWLVRHNDPRAATVEYDRRLFGSITLGEHGKGKRFSRGKDDVDEAAIAYFTDRSEHARDLAYRAVYGDFLLSIGHKAGRVQLLARTIAAYLDACDLFLAEGAYILVRDAIAQALALSATSRDTHLPRATKQARTMLHELAYQSDGIALRSTRQLLGWIIGKYKALQDHISSGFLLGVIERILVTCDNNHFDYGEQGGLTARPLYEERHKFLELGVAHGRKMGDTELARHYERRVAESHIAEAEWWSMNGLMGAEYHAGRAYQAAAKIYNRDC